MLEVFDVEEIKRKESKIKKAFWQQQDDMYTSAHIKAGRKIMQALKKMRAKKEGQMVANANQDQLATIVA